MQNGINFPAPLVYGLDIGTRSIVGTVGYRLRDRFFVVAQTILEHETRAMLDGQIHDINTVGETIREVTKTLEEQIKLPLKEVCVAAAGRVLRTVTTQINMDFEQERHVSREDIYTLHSLGIEKAYEKFQAENNLDIKFYCVGYSVIKYYMNDFPISNLENHKAKTIAADLIATFLPDDVVDGLYRAVEYAGLNVANLTLEPIAAIAVAIPEMYRMLNIALIDVGAGTSDISITRDGSIIAYGMLPIAGDSLTEIIARHCLVDFVTAEDIKRTIELQDFVEYKDIMGLPQTIGKGEVLEILSDSLDKMTKMAVDKILELNGEKPVSAVFVVGGGGRVEGYTDRVAKFLGIMPERCAVRGEEVMQKIEFLNANAVKNSLMVTPIGICLNYYEQSNNFIFVSFNGKRIKLYDNNHLAIVDAALQAEFSHDNLFPKRGKELTFYINGKLRVIRGEPGEAAVVTLNGETAGINSLIRSNDVILVRESTAGDQASMELGKLPEYGGSISFLVNEKNIEVPRMGIVNGEIQTPYYEIMENDRVEMLDYYSVSQIAEFMDVLIDPKMNIYVNNKLADLNTKVYEKFAVIWTMEELNLSDLTQEELQNSLDSVAKANRTKLSKQNDIVVQQDELFVETQVEMQDEILNTSKMIDEEGVVSVGNKKIRLNKTLRVTVNNEVVKMVGKPDYIFVDVFEYIDFDLSKPQGTSVVTKLNGEIAQYVDPLKDQDVLEIFWKQ